MSLKNVTANGVQSAVAEFDQLGREAFLSKYGFGKARDWFLIHQNRCYDSKAIIGVAHRYDRPDSGPLRAKDFKGGLPVARKLKLLGFKIERATEDTP